MECLGSLCRDISPIQPDLGHFQGIPVPEHLPASIPQVGMLLLRHSQVFQEWPLHGNTGKKSSSSALCPRLHLISSGKRHIFVKSCIIAFNWCLWGLGQAGLKWNYSAPGLWGEGEIKEEKTEQEGLEQGRERRG